MRRQILLVSSQIELFCFDKTRKKYFRKQSDFKLQTDLLQRLIDNFSPVKIVSKKTSMKLARLVEHLREDQKNYCSETCIAKIFILSVRKAIVDSNLFLFSCKTLL